jgi:heme exporter protein A
MKLTLSNLSYERSFQLLFPEVSCELVAGDILQVQGANGCGKTTLLRMLAGFLLPTEGDVLWKEHSLKNAEPREEYQQQLIYIGHQNGLKRHLTVAENVKLMHALAGLTISPLLLSELLQKVGLLNFIDSQVKNLSAGQTRRLCFVRLLLSYKPIWILDEPITAIDQDGQKIFATLLKQHVEQGGIAVVATHQSLQLQCNVKLLQLGVQSVA